MTVVNPKSISGITSITTASGSDNLLTIHTSDASNTERLRIDSTGATKIVTGIVTTLTATTGIVTTLTANTITSVDTTESNSATTGAVKIAGGLGVVKNIYTSGAAYVQGTGGLTVTHDVSISDKIIHTDDTNTAIRFPAADTVSVETGGTERLRINSSGQLLSGVTGNAGASDANAVFGGGGAAGSSSHGKIYITNSSSNPTANSAIGFVGFSNQDLSNVPFAFMGVYADADHGSNDYPSRFAFWTTSDGSNSATERLRISSTGKTYFIGNSSGGFNATSLPNGNTVNINTKVSNDGISVIRYSGSYAAYALNIGRSKSDTLGTNGLVADNDDLGHITWYGADGSDFNQAAVISAQVDGTPSDGADMPGRLIFKTSADGSGTPAERVRITQSGKFLVGRTSSITIASDPSDACFEQLTNNGMPLTIHCDQSDQRGFGIYYTSGKNASDFIRCQIASSVKFLVTGNGNAQNANNSYGSISDVSLKENIVDANSQWDDIKNIRVRNYNFKESTGQPTHTQIGVVAQELETVSPKLVEVSDKDGMKNVQYSVLYMKAVKALQESMTRIETLETRLNNAGIAT